MNYQEAIAQYIKQKDLPYALCCMAKWEYNDSIINNREVDFDKVFEDTKNAFYDYCEDNPSFFGLPIDLIS